MRRLNGQKTSTAATIGRVLQSEGLRLSDNTVERSLCRQGLRARVKIKKPLLTKKHQVRRLEWAKKCKHADWEFWAHANFSNESKFNLFGSDGRQYCWRKSGERLLDQHVQSIVKYGGGNIMVWSCMSWEGVGKLHLIEGKMDKYVYHNI